MQLVPRKRRGQPITLRDAMNQMFDEAFWDPFHILRDDMSLSTAGFVPDIDISETDEAVHITADVPGYDPGNIKVNLQDDILTIQGTMEEEHEKKKKKYYCKRCASGSFQQSYALPSSVDETKASCKFKNGKLRISVPKKAQEESSTDGNIKVEVE